MEKAPMTCPECNTALTSIDYELWGKKKFNPNTGNYEEDRSWGVQRCISLALPVLRRWIQIRPSNINGC